MTKSYSRYKALLFSLILLIGTIGAGYGFARIYYPAVATIGTDDITGTMILDRTITGDDISTSTSLTITGLTVTNATATDLVVNSTVNISGTTTLATTTITNLASATGNVSMFTNDAGYLTSYTETDPVWTATSSNYLTTANAAATYLPLTGGTISGTLDINGTSTLAGITTLATTTIAGGLTVSNLTAGSIPFAGTGGVISQDNSNLYWDNAGKKLGIRTTSPDELLSVGDSFDILTSKKSIVIGDSTNGGSLQIGSNASSFVQIYTDTAGKATFDIKSEGTYYGNNLVLMQGKVGIGTTSPATLLDVNGAATIRGEADITSLKTATTTQGSIYYVDSAGHAAALGPGTSGQVLKTQGASANPVWGDATKEYHIFKKLTNATNGLTNANDNEQWLEMPDGVWTKSWAYFYVPSGATVNSIKVLIGGNAGSSGSIAVGTKMQSEGNPHVYDTTSWTIDLSSTDLEYDYFTVPTAAYDTLNKGQTWSLQFYRDGDNTSDTWAFTIHVLGAVIDYSL